MAEGARPGPQRIDYFCLQPTREGQASYAHVNEIVAGLRRRGWDVRLVEPPHPRPGRLDGVRRTIALATLQLRFWIACRFRPAPFVYIRAHFAAFPTALLARATGAIVVQELNGPPGDAYDAWPQLRRLDRMLRLMMRAQVRWADALIAVTGGVRDSTAEVTGRRHGYHVIGNGADVDRFIPSRAPGSSAGRPYVVFVGALASWQGIDTVLGGIRSSAWPPAVDLVIAGDGRERQAVRGAAQDDDRVAWLGTIPYADAPALVAGSLAALVPMGNVPRSQFGLSPLKLFEAMACGVPVLVSDLPGLADVVDAAECGLKFPAGDSEALARAVADLVADPVRAKEMGARGRTAAVAQYSWDARAGQTEQVLLGVAAERRSRGRSNTPRGPGS
jgi:glycosyltransferase involved in cell wall biosynthesis